MSQKRIVEIYTAGCPICDETVQLIRELSCPSCEVNVLDLHDPDVERRTAAFLIRSVPSVVIDGKLAGCCAGRVVSVEVLQAAGLGRPL